MKLFKTLLAATTAIGLASSASAADMTMNVAAAQELL